MSCRPACMACSPPLQPCSLNFADSFARLREPIHRNVSQFKLFLPSSPFAMSSQATTAAQVPRTPHPSPTRMATPPPSSAAQHAADKESHQIHGLNLLAAELDPLPQQTPAAASSSGAAASHPPAVTAAAARSSHAPRADPSAMTEEDRQTAKIKQYVRALTKLQAAFQKVDISSIEGQQRHTQRELVHCIGLCCVF